MNIFFVIPPARKNNRVPERVFGCSYGLYAIPNVFILGMASILREDNNYVEIVDAPVINMTFEQFYRYLQDRLDACFVFYSVNLSRDLDIATARLLRKNHPDTPLIFCGPAPTYYIEDFILDNKTFVVRGEPDYAVRDLIRYLRGNSGLRVDDIAGVSYYDNQGIRHNPFRPLISDLDELPFPAQDLIIKEKYYNPKLKERPFTAIITSRGCPYRCTFCVPCSLNFARKIEFQRHNGADRIPPVTFASANRVIAEFRYLRKLGFKAVSIIDDEFLLKPQRVKEICRGIRDLHIKWGCLARVDHLNDEELIENMAEAGCQYVDIGIESFDRRILDDLHKDIDLSKIDDTMRLLKKHKIKPKFNILIAASSLETKQTIKRTIERSLALKPYFIMFNICTPFPGTELYAKAKRENWFVKGDYYPEDVQKASIIQFPHLKKEEIEKIVHQANLKSCTRLGFFWLNLRTLFNIENLFSSFKILIRKLRF